jgi:hypothetical protein
VEQRSLARPAFLLRLVSSRIEQGDEFVASLLQTVAAETANGYSPPMTMLSMALHRSRRSAGSPFRRAAVNSVRSLTRQRTTSAKVVVDLIGPVVERAVESRNSRAAAIRTHCGALPVR